MKWCAQLRSLVFGIGIFIPLSNLYVITKEISLVVENFAVVEDFLQQKEEFLHGGGASSLEEIVCVEVVVVMMVVVVVVPVEVRCIGGCNGRCSGGFSCR